MERAEASDLASRMRGERVETKIGYVNGQWLVHAIVTVPHTDYDGSMTRKSVDIHSWHEWDDHEINRRPQRVRKPRKSDDMAADQATVAKGLNTVYNP